MLIEVLKDSLSSVNTHGPARFIFVTGHSEQYVYSLMQRFADVLDVLSVAYEPVRTKRSLLIGMTTVTFVPYRQSQQEGFTDGLDKTLISFHHDHYSGR